MATVVTVVDASTSVDIRRIKVISDAELRAKIASDAQSGDPQYCAIRPKTFDPTTGQRYEVEFWPAPDSSRTLRYDFPILPAVLSVANKYPMGGAQHSETILASCLAVAKRGAEDEAAYIDRYRRRLAASVDLDKRNKIGEVGGAVADHSSTTLGAVFADLARDVGGERGFGFDPAAYKHDEITRVEMDIQGGLRIFYYPPVLPNERVVHSWSFLKPMVTLSVLSATTDYTLPSDYGGIEGPLYFDDDVGHDPIHMVSPTRLQELRMGLTSSSGHPQYAALRPTKSDGTAIQAWELLLWPSPDKAYTLHYRTFYIPERLTKTVVYPTGGAPHAETVRMACLAQTENDPDGPFHRRFMGRLRTSVAYDRQTAGADFFGYNGDNSADDIQGLRRERGLVSYNSVFYP